MRGGHSLEQRLRRGQGWLALPGTSMHALSAEDLLRLQLVYRDFELLRIG